MAKRVLDWSPILKEPVLLPKRLLRGKRKSYAQEQVPEFPVNSVAEIDTMNITLL